MSTPRPDGRDPATLRPIRLVADPMKFPLASTRIEWGDTHVLCSVSLEDEQPRWMRETPERGWVTAEYDMLPGSTPGGRKQRGRGTPDGRAQEIQRLIGRSLRAVVDLDRLGPRTLKVDCDVLQADGGTRIASIVGGFHALRRACGRLMEQGVITQNPIRERIAAVSVGVVGGVPVVDLNYVEDSSADADMNLVFDGSGNTLEIQGTAEKAPISPATLTRMLELGAGAARQILAILDGGNG